MYTISKFRVTLNEKYRPNEDNLRKREKFPFKILQKLGIPEYYVVIVTQVVLYSRNLKILFF